MRVGELSWTPGATATAYEVYLGTDQTAVSNTTTGSLEYQGSATSAEWLFDIQRNTTYYWRVDTVTAAGTIPGIVWTFTSGNQIFDTHLIAHWKLDDGSGTVASDSSLYLFGNSGTLNGPVWTGGLDNGALLFDGVDDSVTFGTSSSLSGQTDFTLMAWIRTNSATSQVIMQQRDATSFGFNGQYVFKVLADGTLHFLLKKDGVSQFDFATTVTVNDGKWHFVSVVRDGADGHIYIDGNPTPAASASGTITDLDASLIMAIGRDIRENSSPFNGLIDDVKIYDLAKSGLELVDLYNDFNDHFVSNSAPTWNTNPSERGSQQLDRYRE